MPRAAKRKQEATDDGDAVYSGFSEAAVAWEPAPQTTEPGYRAVPQSLSALAKLGYSQEEIHMLVVPKRTLARRSANNEPLSIDETDKALRLERIARHAERVFGNPAKANRWMRKPKLQLGGKAPLAFLASEAGARTIEEMLDRIDYGLFA
jgi:putative toxin-antitoxin system antitoxin component (TIGR02293 family)